MSVLVDELKSEHTVIAGVLQSVKDLGITSKQGQDKLIAAKSGLLSHLKKEDERLYPVLRKAAESDGNLKMTLDTFAKDMEGISTAVMQFFEKYTSSKDISASDFARDFAKIFSTLGMRIQKKGKGLLSG